MRIIAFTDIHGSYSKLYEILSRESPYDVVIIGGDVTTRGTPKEAEEVIRKVQSFGKPIVAVVGNMDPREMDETFEKLGVSINGKGVVLNDVGFFGVSASPPTPFHTPYEISEDEIMRRAQSGWKEIQSAVRSVFVPHAPPRGTKLDRVLLGSHVGSTAVRDFVDEHHPDVVVCGHIHEARGLDSLGTTQMVNCGPVGKGHYSMIELGKSVSIQLKG
ncbi:MAG: metallophosphoesterase [Bacteroidota bacterium]